MEEPPTTIRIFPGELCPVYYTTVLTFRATPTIEVIRLSLQRLQIFEDKSLYELYVGRANEPKDKWTLLAGGELPVEIQEQWKRNQSKERELRFFLKRKEHASLILADIVSQYISPEADNGKVEDMCNLEELSEQTMLSNLRVRFSNKSIYTYVGSILISVNPYYFYSIYNPKYTTMYQGRTLGELPPHIFAIADAAYSTMLAEKTNQTVIISGESGAGKTESTKFLLHHLMSLSTKTDETQSLELITLGTGPVLEAFGNACTVANNNSSRFGKFILVNFRENGAYHGASIEKYLLEKSRIVSQAPEERNYHVFYYLLAGADVGLRERLQLLDMNQYSYLTQGSSPAPPDGAEEYHRLRQSLSMLSFSDEIQLRMFTLLSAILRMGNVSFRKKDNEEAVQIQNVEALGVISSLLQVEEVTLRLALTTRKSRAGGTDCFVTPYRLEEAIATRDSMAKALYGALFDWIVEQVNDSLTYSGVRGPHRGQSIGVLDIFGFEVFKKNSFEQFCINYANEQLQQYFNKHIFKIEQAEYSAESIEWSSVSFVDNQDCLDLIAKRPTGLIPLLDEECSFPGATDHTLFQKFERQHKSNPFYRSPTMKLREPVFTVVHYASDVTYSVQGFREKNRDLMRQGIVDVLKTSKMDLVRALMGLRPYVVHRWHVAYLKVLATFAFRKAGKKQTPKKDGLVATVQFHQFRHGSAPVLTDMKYGKTKSRNQSDFVGAIGKDSPDAFPLQHGGRLRSHFGLRTSKSYELLSDTQQTCIAGRESPPITRSQSERDYATPLVSYGGSPRFPRRRGTDPELEVCEPFPESPVLETITEKVKPDKQDKVEKADKPLQRGESRSRLSSIGQLQQKIRRHWPLSLRSKEAGGEKEKVNRKNWRSAPRMKGAPTVPDPKALHSLARPSSGRHGPSKTVGGQFQASLTSLMDQLEKTNPFFIRCIKSNGHKAPCQFDDELVLRQLQYTGMVETVKIRKAGYPVRMAFQDFYEKFQFMMGPKSADLQLQIQQFLSDLGFQSEDFQIGKSKVFMRESQKQALQAELSEKVLARIVVIQRWVRAKLLRCRLLHMRRSAIIIQSAFRGWRARREWGVLQKRVCNAVLIQSSWRGYLSRRRFVLLKQAAIIFQAYWRGKTARRRFVVLLEELKRKQAELKLREEKRLEELRRLQEELERREEIKRREEIQRQEELKRQEEARKQEEMRLEELRRLEEMRKEEEVKRQEQLQELRRQEEIRRLEKVRRQEEELQRQEAEENAQREKEERERLQEQILEEENRKFKGEKLSTLQNKNETVASMPAVEAPPTQDQVPEKAKPSRSGHARVDSKDLLLDTEVSDVMFHFDTIITELEQSTHEVSPAPERPAGTLSEHEEPSENGVVSQLDEIVELDKEPTVELTTLPVSNSLEIASSEAISEKTSGHEPATAKASIVERRQLFLRPTQTKPHDESPSRDSDVLSRAGKVRSLIAQLQSSRSSPPPSPPPPPLSRDRKQRSHSPSVTSLTEQFPGVDELLNEKRRSYTPPPIRRRIQSPFLAQRETEMKRSIDARWSKATRKSPTRETVASPEVTPSPPREVSHDTTAAQDNKDQREHSSKFEPMLMQLEEEELETTFVTPIRGNKAAGAIDEGSPTPLLKPSLHEPSDPAEISHVPLQQPAVKRRSQVRITIPERTSEPEGKGIPAGVKEKHVVAVPDSEGLVSILKTSKQTEPSSKDQEESSPEKESTGGLLGSPESVEAFYRARSASDITQMRRPHPSGQSYFTKAGRISSRPGHHGILEGETDETKFLDYLHTSAQRRKQIVSVADPLDVLSLKFTPAPPNMLEESSELTSPMTHEEIYRLNHPQRNLASPSDRMRLFSFTKRHLKLPFRSKSKKTSSTVTTPTPGTPPLPGQRSMRKVASPPRVTSAEGSEGVSVKKQHAQPPDRLLAHNFKVVHAAKFSICDVCQKGFTGFMKQSTKCVDCDMTVHRHCEDRAPPCKAQIESGSYVTMSRKKVVKKVEDLDNLGQFLLDKISQITSDECSDSLVNRVFKLSLHEFHASLISTYSLSIQGSGEGSPTPPEEQRLTITFAQLVNNFSNIFKGIAKREGLNDQSYITIGINQIKTFIDEFTKSRRSSTVVRTYSTTIRPATLRRKTLSGKEIVAKLHKGHWFVDKQFKVTTVCEFCSKPIPPLVIEVVCESCGYTCHKDCYKKTPKCEGKGTQRPKTPVSRQFGVRLEDLVPQKSPQIPLVLEKCLSYIENKGLYTQGVYRKSAGAASKKAVRTVLEEDPEHGSLEGYGVHAVASAVGSFFRELPEPLLTRQLYVEFIRATDLGEREERLETLHQLIASLPELNHLVFERLVFHLARVAQHEHINKMSPNNLAIIFAPCLLQGPTDSKNPHEVLKDLTLQTECLQLIITEQVQKLAATLEDIKTLTNVARDTVTKLTQLSESVSTSEPGSRSETKTNGEQDRGGVRASASDAQEKEEFKGRKKNVDEKRRLASELEEIERERVELTVNLPKLEPFIPEDNDRWSIVPTLPQPPRPLKRSRESTPLLYEKPHPTQDGLRLSMPVIIVQQEDQAKNVSWVKRVDRDVSPGNGDCNGPESAPSGSDVLPVLPSSAPLLTHITKKRVSKTPARKPPSAEFRRTIARTESNDTQ